MANLSIWWRTSRWRCHQICSCWRLRTLGRRWQRLFLTSQQANTQTNHKARMPKPKNVVNIIQATTLHGGVWRGHDRSVEQASEETPWAIGRLLVAMLAAASELSGETDTWSHALQSFQKCDVSSTLFKKKIHQISWRDQDRHAVLKMQKAPAVELSTPPEPDHQH